MQNEEGSGPGRIGWRAVASSVLAAAFGVQSSKNRERDFARGSPARYLIMGIVGTLLFVITMYVVVRLVLKSAGA